MYRLSGRVRLLSDLTCIYFVQGVDGGPIKIGRADKPERRFAELQCGSPVQLRLCRTFEAPCEMEARLHALFAPYRLHGEWFGACPMLAQMADAIPDADLTDDAVAIDNPGSYEFRSKMSMGGDCVSRLLRAAA